MMEMEGHFTQPFNDAQPALDEVDFACVDLVITDLTMPTPGEVAIKEMRQRGYDMPILVATGFVDEDKVEYLLKLGAQRIITKPFLMKTMIDSVTALIGKEKRGGMSQAG
ncbi:MAG: response regulator [Candidatus Latescibacteria bacterium]|jgi:DNA-binding response OmpR family regulator|nr:response regulator [Candidatus Latescibacterota bacterium]